MDWENLLNSLSEGASEWWGTFMESPYAPYWCIPVVLLLLFLLLIVRSKRRGKSVLAYEDANGRVEVSRSAINELVQSTCQQIETVTQPKVITYVKKGVPALRIKLKVQGDARMKDIRDRLRNHLRTQLMENLGFEKLGPIDILVTSVGNLPVMPQQTVAPTAAAAPVGASEPSSYQSSSSVAYSSESSGALSDDEIEFDNELDEEKSEKKDS
ncbi:MAG: alkaline shock response membrane anchor protein AmaP [Opitutales bacterium]